MAKIFPAIKLKTIIAIATNNYVGIISIQIVVVVITNQKTEYHLSSFLKRLSVITISVN